MMILITRLYGTQCFMSVHRAMTCHDILLYMISNFIEIMVYHSKREVPWFLSSHPVRQLMKSWSTELFQSAKKEVCKRGDGYCRDHSAKNAQGKPYNSDRLAKGTI